MLDQIGIALTGCIAIWLSQDARASHRRWACIFGLIGQPFWFYAAWQAGQWGIFALSFIYTASWLKGLWNNWLVPATASMPFQSFQSRTQDWMLVCFGAGIAADKRERNHRFFEESTELVQSLGMTASEAHQLVDYVYGRPVGDPKQESGGVSVTHAALCLANDIDMNAAAETELARIWTKVDVIRAKQAAKPKHSPLPEVQS